MRDPDLYKATNPWMGTVLFFVSGHRFMNAAREHLIWLNLKAPDLRKKYLDGTFNPDSDNAKQLEFDRFSELRKQFWVSFSQVFTVAFLAMTTAYMMGVVRVTLPFHLGHMLGFLGTFLIAWAALFELGGPRLASWKGETLSELTHPKIFQCLFLPGAFAALWSVLL
jgi:hypothetical protein